MENDKMKTIFGGVMGFALLYLLFHIIRYFMKHH